MRALARRVLQKPHSRCSPTTAFDHDSLDQLCVRPPLRLASRPGPCSSPSASPCADAKTRRRFLKPWSSSAATSASRASAGRRPAFNRSAKRGSRKNQESKQGIAAMTNSNSESPGLNEHRHSHLSNFLRDQIAEDVRTKKFGDASHPDPLSSRAQRLSPHRPRQGHLHRFRPRRRVRRQDQPALRRHQSREGRDRSTSNPSRRTSTGSASTGRTSATPPTISASSTSGPSSSSGPERRTSTISPPTRSASIAAR